jgi:hypothetical protein
MFDHPLFPAMPRVKHIALLKFKPDAPAGAVADMWRSIEDLPRKIAGILDFSWGPNTSREGLSLGFTHSFVMTFSSAAARDAYLVDPVHVAAAQKVLTLVDTIAVCDHDLAS